MFILRLWFWLRGQVAVEVEGKGAERLLNLALSRGIYLWNVHWLGGRLYFCVGTRGFFRLRPLVRGSHLRLHIRSKGGLPFWLRRLRRRQTLLAGAAFFLVALYAWAACVWSVEVKGSRNAAQAQELVTLLGEKGVNRGVLKERIDLAGIEHEVLARFSDLAWARAYFTGTRFTLEVVPKLLPPPVEGPGHLVARRDGVVLEVFVLAGTGKVEKGATVRAGQVLISGEQGGQPVAARGRVRARVWYEAYREGRPEETLLTRTGRSARARLVRALNKEYLLDGPSTPPFSRYEVETSVKTVLGWRNLRAPVEIIERVYHELNEVKRPLSAEESAERLAAQALTDLKQHLEEGVEITRVEKKVLSTPEDNLTRVRVRIETVEDIAERVPYYPLPREGGPNIGGKEGEAAGGHQQ
ncbi:MAG TPA: sporulation protein YqfD [Firmicutes bacterium]|nr:sporulation protein YqfD [Bacillota bacterium]